MQLRSRFLVDPHSRRIDNESPSIDQLKKLVDTADPLLPQIRFNPHRSPNSIFFTWYKCTIYTS